MREGTYGIWDAMRDALIFSSGAFIGATCGAVIGATAALLFAPQSGKESRELITRKIDNARNTAVDMGEELIEKAEELTQRTAEKVEAVVEEAKGELMKNADALEHRLEGLRKRQAA